VNLSSSLRQRSADARPIGIGLIGAGKFGTMFLAQVQKTPGLRLVGIADILPEKIQGALDKVHWTDDIPLKTSEVELLVKTAGVEVVVEATGDPIAGAKHALACFEAKRHLVMVNVECDALVGPILARRAQKAGVIYSLAYGDQPALICELVDWAETCGFEVVCAGKGTKYLPSYHFSTPDSVWQHYGLDAEQVKAGDFNPRMFNSFIDGTKSAIEMAAVANATGLKPPSAGLGFPPCGIDDISAKLIPDKAGGILEFPGTVEVVSSLRRDETPVVNDLRWGIYVTFSASGDYSRRCFKEYGLKTDLTGEFASLYRPFHLIGMELGISVASVALRGEPTGIPKSFLADVVAIAKRDLHAGDILDGEGGYTIYGQLTSAELAISEGALPIGLASGLRLTQRVHQGSIVRWTNVEAPDTSLALELRHEMEKSFLGGYI